jgi:hypothetical protein
VLQAFKFIVKVEHVICLLVAESAVSVTCEYINHVLLLLALDMGFSVSVVVCLGDGVIQHILFFNELCGNFYVRVSHALKVSLLVQVVVHVPLPGCETIGKAHLLRKLAYICN